MKSIFTQRQYFLLFVLILLGNLGKPLFAQTEVSSQSELENAVADAAGGTTVTITLSSQFPSTLDNVITLANTNSSRIVIDGNNLELLPNPGSRHFKVTKGDGFIEFRNLTLRGYYDENAGTPSPAESGGVEIASGTGEISFGNVHFTHIRNYGAINGAFNNRLKIEKSTFEYNYSPLAGGALCFEGGIKALNVDYSTFNRNSSNGTGYSGGAINVKVGGSGSVVDIRNSVFLYNSTKHLGGAIAFHIVNPPTANFTIDACYFEGNKTVNPGGANYGPWADAGAIGLYSDNGDHNFTLTNSTFVSNESYDDGGALMIQNWGTNSSNTISNNTFYSNISWGQGIISNNNPPTDAGGGAIQFSKKTKADLKNNTFVGNKASGKNNPQLTALGGSRGGAIAYHYDTGSNKVYPELSMENNILAGNYVTDENDDIMPGDYANITITSHGVLNDLGGNIGIDDGIPLANNVTTMNIFGTSTPVLQDNQSNVYAGNPNDNTTGYYVLLQTIPILPNDNESIFGLADGSVVTPSQPADQRGYARVNGSSDAGSVEMLWVRFDANGGRWNGLPSLNYTGVEYYAQDVNVNTSKYFKITHTDATVTSPSADPVHDTYTFGGWVLDDGSDTPWNPATQVAENVKVKALWNGGNTYTVSYHGNENTGGTVPASQQVQAGTIYTVAEDKPSKRGYLFEGWNSSDDNRVYHAGYTFTMPEQNVSLTALWKEINIPGPGTDPVPGVELMDLAAVCPTEKVVRGEFNTLYTDNPMHYAIAFSEDAKAAGFKDLEEYILLPAGYFVFEVLASVPNGLYQGVLKLKCEENPQLIEEYPFEFEVLEGIQILEHPQTVESVCNGSVFELTVSAAGHGLAYQWYHNGRPISGATGNVYEAEISNETKGEYYVQVAGTCGYINSDTVYVIQNALQIQIKWDDVLYVTNTDSRYKSFQWYKDGMPVSTYGNGIYYTDTEGLRGSYSVRAYYPDGSFDESCPVYFDGQTKSSSVRVYPNPVKPYETITVEINGMEDNQANVPIYIYDMSGGRVYSGKSAGQRTDIVAAVPSGNYIVHIRLHSGKVYTQKLIVK
ncbi:InlB B-repeat-containing protein [Parabacteroides chinchillae]|uniref:Listeria/Bacterioides repeat-containing protein/Por secretion system C-terminal sorting domain-containing protein n=1 Tax=Parabacteroides chinchillae TaxID=871327 RepID=A0A8G2F1C8_9BACT|nr:InlB B-repeat-containing protein [Parabacteroides chinchillae]SEF85221.1 Listeria/Bacterioides repeat-containing protein/Por secretion system C-terminal sorting domain-containing protein [Parabacteroides chinchillae]